MTEPTSISASKAPVPSSDEMVASLKEAGADAATHGEIQTVKHHFSSDPANRVKYTSGDMQLMPSHGDGHDHEWVDRGHEVQCVICHWGFAYGADDRVIRDENGLSRVVHADGTVII